MKKFILNLILNESKKRIEEFGQLSAGTITAIVVYELKPENIKGMYWKVEKILSQLVRERKIAKVKGNYYPTENPPL